MEQNKTKKTKEHFQYSRDFLLKYENISKPDPRICALLTPFLTVSQPTSPNGLKSKHKLNSSKPSGGPKSPNDKKAHSIWPSSPNGQKEVSKVDTLLSSPQKSKFTSFLPDSNSKNPNVMTPPTSPRSPPVSPRSPPISPRSPPSTPRSPSSTPNPYSANKTTFTPSQHPYPSTPSYFNTPPTKISNSSKSTPVRHTGPRNNAGIPQFSPQTPGARIRVPRPISPLDDSRLMQRQKQIDYGKRTVGYLRYRLFVPKDQRKPEHPRTPKKTQGCSKRSWDGQLKKWRRDLHLWDPDNMSAFKVLLSSDLVETIIEANPDLAEIVTIIQEKLSDPAFELGNDSDIEEKNEENEKEDEQNSDEENEEEEEEEQDNQNNQNDKNQIKNETHNRVARTLVFV